MAEKRKFRVPVPQGLSLWAPVTLLLALGLGTTIVDFAALEKQESARAMAERQRFIVDARSGRILMGGGEKAKEEPEETPTEEHAEAPATEKPAAEHAAEPAKAEEHPAEEAPKAEAEKPAEAEHPAEKPVEEKPAEPVAAATQPAPAEAAPAEPAATASETLPANAPTLRTEPAKLEINDQPRTKDSLVSAPAPEVTETVDGLKLPKRGDKDVLPSRLYARPFKRKPEQVLISFVVMDVGLDPQSIGLLLNMPAEINAAYSPYTRPTMGYSENLRALGHEVWTMLPVMGERYPSDDPGPMGLIAKMPDEEIVRRTREVLAAIPGSVGVVLPPNETISQQKDALTPAIKEIDARGLLVTSTHPSRTVDQVAGDAKLAPIVRRADLVLDPSPNESQIRSKLAGLLDAAKERGELVVALSARPQSLQILREWLKDTKLPENYVLAPMSAMYQPKEPVEAAPAEEEGGGHGGGEKKKEQKKPEAKPKKPKVLPQDQYKQPPPGEKKGGH